MSLLSRITLVAGLSTAFVAPANSQQPEMPWLGELVPGPYRVGFDSQSLQRNTGDGESRELTVSIWFPASDGTGTRARLADLFEIVLREGQLTEAVDLPLPRGLTAAMTGDESALSAPAAEQALAMPIFSHLEAQPAPGRFPLAIWSSRHATALAQAPLSEVLASHGYVVATVWSSDPPIAFLWEDHPDSLKLETIDVQTSDLQHVLSMMRRRDNVAAAGSVILAWSYGGQTAARLQERDDQIAGIVGLDANVVPARPEERLALRVPLVWLLGKDSSGRGLENVEGLTAPNLVLALPSLSHGNFNAMEGFLPGLLEAKTVFRWSTGGRVAVDGYAALVRMTLEAVGVLREPDATLVNLWDRMKPAAENVSVELAHDGSTQ